MNLQTILDQLATDTEFRTAFLNNPASALQHLDLEAPDELLAIVARINVTAGQLVPDLSNHGC